MVKKCTLTTQLSGKANLVVTELGVIRVTEIGFELVEISPGVGSDDIRMQVHASLHVADDVKGIQLCA
jgi:acyl CoA:acetate/3-ketoacid CoA transferase beta subunit